MNSMRALLVSASAVLLNCSSEATSIDGPPENNSSSGGPSGISSSSSGGSGASGGVVTDAGSSSPATCADGVRNGDESDVDCGGTCGRCALDRACGQGTDCVSGNCRASKCASPVTTQVSVGFDSACALSSNGRVKCWGRTGNGGDEDVNMPPGQPLNFGAGRTAVFVDVGRQTACAILDDGSLSCWGNAAQFGRSTPYTVPTRMTLPAGRRAVAVDSHDFVIRALLDDGTLTTITRGVPRELEVGAGRKAITVANGNQFGCVLRDDASVICTAPNNNRGVLGIGAAQAPAPALLGNGRTARSIGAGYDHACAVLDDNTLKCWGRQLDSNQGQAFQATPTVVNFPGGRRAKAVVGGRDHSCALLDNDTVSCWGSDALGQLGDGPGNQSRRLPNGTTVSLNGQPVRALSSFENATCALLADDSVRCWGTGAVGGTLRDAPSPAPAVDLRF